MFSDFPTGMQKKATSSSTAEFQVGIIRVKWKRMIDDKHNSIFYDGKGHMQLNRKADISYHFRFIFSTKVPYCVQYNIVIWLVFWVEIKTEHVERR